ncbi:unnamed protein product [Rotaria magnacalcarata]
MVYRSLNYLRSLHYDITVPIYANDDKVQRRNYLVDDAIRTKRSPVESVSDEAVPSYMDKLKARATQNSVQHIMDKSNSLSDLQSHGVYERKDNEEFTLVWLDQRLDNDKPDLRNLATLRDVVDFLRTFTDLDACCEYISKISHSNVYLIVSGTTGYQIVPRVHDWMQIRSIYVLCRRKQEQKNWTSAHAKIRPEDIFTNVNLLIERLKIDLYKCQKAHRISYKIERSIVDIHSNEIDFQWSYRLTQALISWPRYPEAQNQLVEHMRDYYRGSQSSIEFLDEFARDYMATDAVRWYTRPGCLFRLVNQAFRDESIDEIFKYRSFIKDLSENLTLLHNEQREYGSNQYNLYRGTCLPYDDIAVLKSNQGKLISFNGFLSTTVDRDIALVFVQPSNEQDQVEAVLFEYNVNTSLDTHAYANIGSQSAIPDEQEFLFNIGAIFRIESMKYDSDEKLWLVRCVLCEKKDLRQLHIQGISSTNENALTVYNYGDILIEMGEYVRAERFFGALSNEVKDDSAKAIFLFKLLNIYSITKDRIRFTQTFEKALQYSSSLEEKLGNVNAVFNLFRILGCACSTAGRFDDALECFALDMSLINDDNTIQNRRCLAKTLGAIGQVYFQRGEYARALECYQQEGKLAEELYKPTIERADFYERFGALYLALTDFDMALQYFGKALDIARNILPSNHLSLHTLHNNIGLVYLHQGYLELALECFTTIADSPSQMPELYILSVALYANIGLIYLLQNKFDLSFTYCNKAITSHLKLHPRSYHPNLANLYIQTADVLKKQGKFDDAQNFLLKAYEIFEKKNMPLKIVECFTEMSNLNIEKGNPRDAMICMAKALSMGKQICGENHISVAIAYRNMSTIWLLIGNTERALQLAARSALIFKLWLANAPLECATTYETLGCVHLKKSDYLLALKYFKKTIQIRKKYLSDDHSQMGTAYYRLGQAYVFLERFDIALQYYQKALGSGGEHYLIYRDLGDMNSLQNKNDQALEFYEKALASAKHKYGDNQVEIATIYSRIADVHCLREEYKLAAEYFIKTLDYYEKNVPDRREFISEYSLYVARAFNEVGQHTQAIEYFKRALKNLPEGDSQLLKTRWEIAVSNKLLADKYSKESNFVKALQYYEHALEILRQWFPLQVDMIETIESCFKQISAFLRSNQ